MFPHRRPTPGVATRSSGPRPTHRRPATSRTSTGSTPTSSPRSWRPTTPAGHPPSGVTTRTWAACQVRTGAAPDQRTLTEYRYFRGIDGASVEYHEGVAVTDREAFAGMTRSEATYNGDGGKLETTTSYVPWRSAATATETRAEGLPARHAYATGGKSEQTRTAVGTGWRTVRKERTFDQFGQVLTESSLGDTAK